MIGENTGLLEFEQPGASERGSDGRLLAYRCVDGKNLNGELARQGFSAEDTQYGRGQVRGTG